MERTIESVTVSITKTLYANGDPDKAILASLRGAASFSSPKAQKFWPLVMQRLPEKLLSRDGTPTPAENAVYAAVRLYALHQQSNTACVYAPASRGTTDADATGVPFFTAVARLKRDPKRVVAVDRRTQQALAMTQFGAVMNALTHLVGMVRANQPGVQIDYGRLGQDLYWFQRGYREAAQVRLIWGQDFYFESTQSTEGTEA
ncbi:type I-E CRISPR-associated protein Cse2/CasB [Lacticaseibacillus absianus]|uniref:type I-E CRISPR-associated protein Cse2/CasB n=1 Tax=Lacticaseibacillus absianus TaxID=2729623 RepID=UPI0015C83061|nr:type I-E CRISPR-associated protein Cse2/CasB [Lacticaseibacillus absianus]